MYTTAPKSIAELQKSLSKITGQSLVSLADQYALQVPSSQQYAKGWAGQLIEAHLGADAGNQAVPDFTKLGIELKTVPVDQNLKPKESTYICTAPINQQALMETWLTSRVYQKIKHILWVPILINNSHFSLSTIAYPIFWQPSPSETQILQSDWLELTDLLYFGQAEALSAHLGTYLQIRPKAAHSRILQQKYNQDDILSWLGPKGFYLRPSFTAKLLRAF